MVNQPLRGLVGQAMSGHRASSAADTSLYPVGTWTFTAPRSRSYRFALWGGGGGGSTAVGGGSGGYAEVIRSIGAGQRVTIVVGAGGAPLNPGLTSTITFPSGEVVTCTAGGSAAASGAAGAASTIAQTAGDIMLAGSAGGGSGAAGAAGLGSAGGIAGAAGGGGGGAGAPGNAPHRGGSGGDGGSGDHGRTPAAGGSGVSGGSGPGGDGLAIVYAPTA